MRVAGAFSDDIAVDLGTANTLVHARGRGIVIDEPSVVAVLARGASREIVAVGLKARTVAAREPGRIELIRPLRDGVIADFVATEQMLRDFLGRTKTLLGFRRPQTLISVPAGATPVERRAVYESAVSVGARRVHLIEEPVAAAIGIGLPIEEAAAVMVVDIGGGTTDIAIMREGEVVEARSLKRAGNAMDEAISRHIRSEYGLLVGELNAERIKIEAGAATEVAASHGIEAHIRGREIAEGRYRSVVMLPADVARALSGVVAEIGDFVVRCLDELPDGVVAALGAGGVRLSGGGALLPGLDRELARRTGLAFTVSPNPMHCVVKGSALVLERIEDYEALLIDP